MNLTYAIRLTLIAGALVFPAFPAIAEDEAQPVSNRYFVKTEKSIWKKTFNARNTFKGGFTADLSPIQLNIAKFMGVETSPVRVFQVSPLFSQLSRSAESPDKSDIKTEVTQSKREYPPVQTGWNIALMRPDVESDLANESNHINVAVLDTGISQHPDLERRIVDCRDFSSVSGSAVQDRCTDKNGHGTAVASLIAADTSEDGKGIEGVAPSVSILAYKVCNDNGYCFADDIAVAVRAAIAAKARIINMSFGSDEPSDLIEAAIKEGQAKDVVFVAAAGNDGPEAKSVDYPAAYDSVLSVGAISEDLKVPTWSSRGLDADGVPAVDFAAPGNKVLAATATGGYALVSGTSMAAAHISGLIAFFMAANEEVNFSDILTLLKESAVDIDKKGPDATSGFGLPRLR